MHLPAIKELAWRTLQRLMLNVRSNYMPEDIIHGDNISSTLPLQMKGPMSEILALIMRPLVRELGVLKYDLKSSNITVVNILLLPFLCVID